MSGQHAYLQPSKAARWMACPGSPAMEARAGERPATQAALEGTVCHAILAYTLNSGKDLARDMWYGAQVDPETGLIGPPWTTEPVAVTLDMLDWVEQVEGWVRFYLAAFPGTVLRVEARVPVGAAFGVPDKLWGTADVILVRPEELCVLDAKFGYVTVDHEENPQVGLYAIGAAHDYGWVHPQYTLGVLQPRVWDRPRTETLTREELQDRLARYRPRVAEALAPAGMLVPNDECDYCDAAGMCPALQADAQSQALVAFTEPEKLDLDKLVVILSNADRVRSALNAAEAYALKRLELGEPVPGFKRVMTRANRKWANPVEAARVLSMLADPRDFTTRPELASPAQVEKRLRMPTHALDALAPAPDGNPVLVPESDNRPALPPAFTKVEEE